MSEANPSNEAVVTVRLSLPDQSVATSDSTELRARFGEIAAAGQVLVITALERPLVSDAQIARAVARVTPGRVVVAVAPVTDTVRGPDGSVVDRDEFVELCSPVVLAPDVVAVLSSSDRVPASVADIVARARLAGADIVTIDDDGSGAWAGEGDHLAVARARVGR